MQQHFCITVHQVHGEAAELGKYQELFYILFFVLSLLLAFFSRIKCLSLQRRVDYICWQSWKSRTSIWTWTLTER
ncbi:hypothetical protein P152DRAFT_36134 [Eremomyces bilateralis CBS 781.70]|uniref:Uncharacterized protein n=1 Tax=Eremomyces bilateralis CBS 781.70 TaxID=1392243 RepID=A0A6G1G247_9PEZI|nr:uncharacterized protein P152DRAFT_36134 [Eremomyces bilateralis CBS 781.70]KAF1811879.1 hypothetical protein P152DRAFT_36134 [Eremomyces bilateralis CBS 781.70]